MSGTFGDVRRDVMQPYSLGGITKAWGKGIMASMLMIGKGVNRRGGDVNVCRGSGASACGETVDVFGYDKQTQERSGRQSSVA